MLRRTHYSQSIDAERNLRLRKTPDEIAIKILHFQKSLGGKLYLDFNIANADDLLEQPSCKCIQLDRHAKTVNQ
jgi:hypothetical protein